MNSFRAGASVSRDRPCSSCRCLAALRTSLVRTRPDRRRSRRRRLQRQHRRHPWQPLRAGRIRNPLPSFQHYPRLRSWRQPYPSRRSIPRSRRRRRSCFGWRYRSWSRHIRPVLLPLLRPTRASSNHYSTSLEYSTRSRMRSLSLTILGASFLLGCANIGPTASSAHGDASVHDAPSTTNHDAKVGTDANNGGGGNGGTFANGGTVGGPVEQRRRDKLT
jgi:hypothetical protein